MTEKQKAGLSAFESSGEEEHGFLIPNAQRPEETLGTMYLRRVKQPILDKYRDIRNGEGRRKGNPAEARRFLFKRAYVRFEFSNPAMEIDLGDYANEVEFFSRGAEMLVDAVLLQYLDKLFPDVLDQKK